VTRKTRILGVSYNATSNELVRTNTLVKGAIVQIDATPFKQWYEKYYGAPLGKKKKEETQATTTTTATTTTATTTTATATTKPPDKSKGTKEVEKLSRKKKKRQKMMKIEPHLEEQFNTGRLYAKITSRPGQCGRADGYILEGDELAFYLRKIMARKKAAKQ
jgi:small subunit ribosomal protein S8e